MLTIKYRIFGTNLRQGNNRPPICNRKNFPPSKKNNITQVCFRKKNPAKIIKMKEDFSKLVNSQLVIENMSLFQDSGVDLREIKS